MNSSSLLHGYSIESTDSPSTLLRARRYLEKLPHSIQGQQGSKALFSAACCLVRGFALSNDEAMALLAEWNLTHCVPPWSLSDLKRVIKSASSTNGQKGHLLDRPGETSRHPGLTHSSWMSRSRWPTFHPLSTEDVERIAELRSLPTEAVDVARRLEVLKIARVDGHRCYVLHEGKFSQARRLDGKPFSMPDGREIKAKNLPGSEGAFVGACALGKEANVILVEGCVGWMEGVAAVLISDRTDWTVLAATSASSRFNRAPELLKTLAGRRVRIIPDSDVAGREAAASWLADLESVRCQVDAVGLPPGTKDLGDLLRMGERAHETLNSLFR
ncbi:MAG: hypothetical protein JNJ83_24275 [Verrucomicrobiaceae bacterium]|nr:hypothetical protein [Verrucomicrobiaceae bacterium]